MPTNESAVPDDLFAKTPALPWCFDLILFYQSGEDDEQARNVLRQLQTYSRFSFIVNGVITCLLAGFGLLGNVMFVYQIHKSRYFSRRLAYHLTLLCLWDMALLLCCLLTYGVISLYYGIIPIVGIVAYLLYFFQPFASFCVTGTIWQVLAVTIERYTAVSRPLEQRTRNAQFSVRSICLAIALGAFLLNMMVVPFERSLMNCYEFTQNGFESNIMIAQEEIVNNQYYAILVHLIPDILFRAPTPIIIIAFLTVRTLQICSRRTVGGQIIQARRNVPYMLTLLNIKFICCNTLYLFNTILMEVMGYGGKTSSQQTEIQMEQYIRSLYLTDLSNMLLAVHSATNWLIFYHWPRFSSSHKKYSTLTITTSANNSKAVAIDRNAAELLLSKFSAHKFQISSDILTALCNEFPQIATVLLGETETGHSVSEKQKLHNRLQKHSALLANIIEDVLFALTNKGFSVDEWRELCRQIGYRYHEVNPHCGAEQWKLVRDVLVYGVSQHSGSKWYGSRLHQSGTANLQKTTVRVFNFALREMKSGALCATVDAAHQHIRVTKTAEPITLSRLNSASAFSKTVRIPRRSSLKAADSFGNSSLDSSALDSPTIHSRSRTIWSRFSFFTGPANAFCEA